MRRSGGSSGIGLCRREILELRARQGFSVCVRCWLPGCGLTEAKDAAVFRRVLSDCAAGIYRAQTLGIDRDLGFEIKLNWEVPVFLR